VAVWIQLFAHLLAGGVITGNPMGAVPKPKAARGAPAAFTDTDLSALIATLKDGDIPARRPWTARDYALVTTLALTGLRRAELLALAVDDVEGSPRERQLAVRHGKGDNYRAIPIQPALEHLIEHYLRERWGPVPDQRRPSPTNPWSAPARTPLWVGDQGRAMTTSQLGHLVQRAYRAAGINSRRPPGALVHGNATDNRHPDPSALRAPASTWPPNSAARSRIPTRPRWEPRPVDRPSSSTRTTTLSGR